MQIAGVGLPLYARRSPRAVRAASFDQVCLQAGETHAQRPVFGEPTLHPRPQPVKADGEELARQLAPTLTRHTVNYRYNSLLPMLDFVNHLNGQPAECTFRQGFESYAPDLVGDMEKTGGRSCVGMALTLRDDLRRQGLPAYICPVSLPEALQHGNPLAFGHTAVIVPFQHDDDQGYVILDPGLSIPKPIVVRPDQTVSLIPWENSPHPQTWTFQFESPQVLTCDVRIHNSSGGGTSRFLIDQEWTDPEATLGRCASLNPRPRISARDAHGETVAAVAVEMRRPGSVRVVVESQGQRQRFPYQGDKWQQAISPQLAAQLLPHSKNPRQDLIEAVQCCSQSMPGLQTAIQAVLS
ncbi:MAG: hypothetical protein KC910_30915 [Candidatus Eremiobacteraeota bacterium]|nr:hypothetical protein [Candidatus Eremiobacteraeota bacterium]